MNLIKLSSELIRFKSVTPNSAGSLEFIEKILKKNNFNCYLLEFGNKKIKNLYAEIKGGKGPNLCFAGHTDVVPAGNLKDWTTNPFKPTIKNGILYGRGASDMKTAIAAFVHASLEFLSSCKNKFDGSLSFLLTADEEGEADFGTKSMVNWLKKKNHKIDLCLVGEPTNPNYLGEMIKVGRRGSLNGEIIVKGIQGHVAYPEKCKNPIDDLLKICNQLKLPIDKGSKLFQPSKLVITSIDVGNKVTNLVVDRATIKFNVRFSDKHKSKDIIKLIKQRLNKTKSDYELNIKVSGESFHNSSKKLVDPLINSIKKVTTKTPKLSTSGGTSDARFISKICPVIEFGIVGKTMHKINENINIRDLEDLSKIYLNFINNVFKPKY